MTSEAEAWASYWRDVSGAAGCAPHSPGIAAASRLAWQDFARSLPRKARLLDLATGNGAVLQHVRAVRPDLHLTGVDSAPDLGASPIDKVKLKAGVRMEALPFERGSFDAATSQFGYEYGVTATIAGELGRVLRAGASLRLLVHHRDSPVVLQGRSRLSALAWALGTEAPLRRMEQLAAARGLAPLPVPPSLRGAPAQAAALFPEQTVAAELMLGGLQVLDRGGARAAELLGGLRRKAEAEAARLQALLKAARDEEAMAQLQQELEVTGLTSIRISAVNEAGQGPVFAWLLDGQRA